MLPTIRKRDSLQNGIRVSKLPNWMQLTVNWVSLNVHGWYCIKGSNVIHVHIICYDAICIHSFKELLWIWIMSLWKSCHVLCTTELYCQVLGPVIADCTYSTVWYFLVVRVKLCREGISGDWRYSLTNSSRWAEWSHASAALPPGERASAAHWIVSRSGLGAGLDVREKREFASSRLVITNFHFLSNVTGSARKVAFRSAC
jgi:hypothetical protein